MESFGQDVWNIKMSAASKMTRTPRWFLQYGKPGEHASESCSKWIAIFVSSRHCKCSKDEFDWQELKYEIEHEIAIIVKLVFGFESSRVDENGFSSDAFTTDTIWTAFLQEKQLEALNRQSSNLLAGPARKKTSLREALTYSIASSRMPMLVVRTQRECFPEQALLAD